MNDLLQRIWSHITTDVAVVAFVGAGFLADSGEVRDVIALGALVAALAVIWTKVVRPGWEIAAVYRQLPHDVANLRVSVDSLHLLVETIVTPPEPDITGTPI